MNQKKLDYQWAWHCARAIKNLSTRNPYSLQVNDIVRMSLELHETGLADVVMQHLSDRDYTESRMAMYRELRYGWYRTRLEYKRLVGAEARKEVTHER